MAVVPILSLPILLLAVAIGLFGTIFWIWMLIDCLRKEPGTGKLLWGVIIFFTYILGAGIYYIFRRTVRQGLAEE